MRRKRLSGRAGAGLDPCAALQTRIELAEGQEREVVFVFGAARNSDEAQHFMQRFGGLTGARQALEAVWEHWNRTLGAVHVETPDPALDVLANGWLVYQTLSCRLWGRSGYYQSGGAYGFRDQLQDTMALIHATPWLAREQLIRCAERQFRQGDGFADPGVSHQADEGRTVFVQPHGPYGQPVFREIAPHRTIGGLGRWVRPSVNPFPADGIPVDG